jgi:hypothetical protein
LVVMRIEKEVLTIILFLKGIKKFVVKRFLTVLQFGHLFLNLIGFK